MEREKEDKREGSREKGWKIGVCVCVVVPLILDSVLQLSVYVGVPAGVIQEYGQHTGAFFLFASSLYLPSAVLPCVFIARRVRQYLSLVNR